MAPTAPAEDLHFDSTTLTGKMSEMTHNQAMRAPFTAIPMGELTIRAGKLDRRLEWMEDGFANVIVDQFGDALRLLRGGIDAHKMADDMNMEAAAMIMAEGTPAARLLKEK